MPKISQVAWAPSFKRAFRKRIVGTSSEKLFRQRLETFLENPFAPVLVVFDFVSPGEVLLIDIGPHDDVY